ncbi:hypothetical protein [Asticcacaulis sp. YBE204]|uniref:hypothetical protein n=1 Tax=Asticcacaulis sp. YBE204 TaxID=1282363 RepID=UPI0003C3B1CE|nr:hypothetical protein [Asticcacaulis sp. YBE204]ESQ78392.1 hypothetical protein AEYBE204_14565 [Asticcacaulis sp. YBE204]
MAQGPLDAGLDKVVRVGDSAGQGARKPPQARQQRNDSGAGGMRIDLRAPVTSTNGQRTFLRNL